MSGKIGNKEQQLLAEIDGLKQRVAELEEKQLESEQYEQQLLDAHKQLSATLNALPDILFTIDRHGRIYDYRAPRPELLYTTPDKFMGKLMGDVLPVEVTKILMGAIEKAIAAGYYTGAIYPLDTPAGSGWFELSVACQGDPQEADGRLVVLIRDITERKRATQEREALIAELAAKNQELEQFAHSVSHDLKSPLITIKGFLSYVEEAVSAGNVARASADLARIRGAADKMVILLDGLLTLSQIGGLGQPPVPLSLNEVAEEAASQVAGQLRQRGVELSIMPHMPLVMGHQARLRQALQNLLENGIKFMGDQPNPRIELGAHQQGQMVTGYVKDNGIGIALRYTEQIFNLFEQLDRQSPGAGIGLALVKRIFDLHGGRIWVDSAGDGQGSTFYFCIPAVPSRSRST
jgi:signal transduction histidine kinase